MEPLIEQWNAGDKIQIVAGPQAALSLANLRLQGEFMPQDHITGVTLANDGNRPANAAALMIGSPGSQNFSKGVEAYLAKDGTGDGIVVGACNEWDKRELSGPNRAAKRGAFIAPANVPALRDEYGSFPYLIFARPEENLEKGNLQIRNADNSTMMQFNRNDVAVKAPTSFAGPVTFTDSVKLPAQTRGKQVLNGDGKTKQFIIKFATPFASEPFVTISTNQFAASRIVAITAEQLTVEFQTAPATGNSNITIWWHAQE